MLLLADSICCCFVVLLFFLFGNFFFFLFPTPKQEAKSEYTYGSDCVHIAGVKDGCPDSLTHSPYLTSAQEYYEHYKTVIDRQDWIDKGTQINYFIYSFFLLHMYVCAHTRTQFLILFFLKFCVTHISFFIFFFNFFLIFFFLFCCCC